MTALADLGREHLPVTVSQYVFIDVLGSGAMGRVFRARRQGAEGFARLRE